MDKHKNFAYSTVATAPSPATSGTSLVVAAGHGTRFPAVPFYATVWAVGVVPEPTTAEIVRVTAISTDTLTIARAQESSSARSVIVGDQIAATITDQVLRDAEDMHYESRSTNTILGYADKGKTIDITATITQTFEADETLGDGWWVILRNATDEGTVVVTLNPDGSETIDGLTTVTMYSGETRRIMCNGAGGNFNSTLLSSGFARFTADGNFILPHGVTMLRVDLVAGGGGGGGGRGGSAGSIRHGGAGGGGGARHIWDLPATDAGNPGDTIAVDIATGGPNGTGGSAADGTNGTAGGNTTFGSLLTVYGGGGGAGGTANTNRHQGGTGGGVMEAGTSGTTHTTSLRGGGQMIVPADAGTPQGYGLAGGGIKATSGATSPFSGSGEYGGGAGGITSGAGAGSGAPGGASLLGGGGGACGGGLDTSNNERAGNAGGAGGAFGTAGSGGGGTVGAADGGAGGNGASGNLRYCGVGGGGGGSQASGTGGAGGTGGVPGGGGAGGGAGTTVGGAGGAGAIGECRVSYS